MPLKIAFQMEGLEEVNPRKNTTSLIMLECQNRGHEVYQYHPTELSFKNGQVLAKARKVELDLEKESFYSLGEDHLLDLSLVDVVHIRQNPPFNMEYITSTYILEKISDKTLIVNNPKTIRDFPEKIFPSLFADFTPPTLITSDSSALESFRDEQGDIIIKPLYMFGGNDISLLKKDDENFAGKLQQLVEKHNAPIVAQKFIPEVSIGDKRITLIDGEIAAVYLRVAEEGSIVSNIIAGGTLKETEITKRDQEICDALKPVLKEKGVIFCGIDVIGSYLTEINITSPSGFHELRNLDKDYPVKKLCDVVESKVF